MNRLSITIISTLILLTACVREENPWRDAESSRITFLPSVAVPDLTKTIETMTSGSFRLTDETGAMSIPMSFYGSVCTADPFPHMSTEGETKGNMVTDESQITKFNVCAFKGNDRFIPKASETGNYATATWDDESRSWKVGDFEWTDNSSRTFYGYSNEAEGALSLKSQSNAAQSLTYAVPANASTQTDFLLGYFSGTPAACEDKTGVQCRVPLAFSHPLVSVRFKKGDSFIDLDGNVTKIELSGVYESGTVTMSQNSENTSVADVDWDDLQGGFAVYEEKEGGLDIDSETDVIGEPFFLIPQTDGEVTITITIKKGAEECRKVSATIKPKWVAGHSYVYTFGEGFMPEICDDTSIKNTGTQSGYLRAAVVAYTVDGSDVVTGPAAVPPVIGEGWTQDVDGFYLYNSTPLEPGKSTPVLVTNKVDVTSSSAKLKILVQASTAQFN